MKSHVPRSRNYPSIHGSSLPSTTTSISTTGTTSSATNSYDDSDDINDISDSDYSEYKPKSRSKFPSFRKKLLKKFSNSRNHILQPNINIRSNILRPIHFLLFHFHTGTRTRIRANYSKKKKRVLLSILTCGTFFLIIAIISKIIRPDPFFYPPEYIRREVDTVQPLSGCFDSQRISSEYSYDYHNDNSSRSPMYYNDIQEGKPMEKGRDCYDLASTIRYHPQQLLERQQKNNGGGGEITYFHTYWRVDLAPFEEREEYFLKSFFATQTIHNNNTVLIIWSNGDLSSSPILSKWLNLYPHALQLRQFDMVELARGTALEGNYPLLHLEDSRAWVDGDVLRLLVLWVFGGVWVDMDFLFTRDIGPLLEHEFLMRWDCHG